MPGKKKPELRSFIRAVGIGAGFGGLFFGLWVGLSYLLGAPAGEAYAWGRMGFIVVMVGSLAAWALKNDINLDHSEETEG